jgi:RHS repeat-associated protein
MAASAYLRSSPPPKGDLVLRRCMPLNRLVRLVALVSTVVVVALLLPLAALATAPANTAPPTISGSAVVGSSLTGTTGTWANSPTSYGYQWRRCGYSTAVLADTPVGYWRMDDPIPSTQVADSSGNGNTGTYVNGPTLGAAGGLAGDSDAAVSFSGTNQYATVPNSTSLNSPSTAITLEAVVKPGTVTSQVPIVLKSPSTFDNPYYQYGLFLDTTKGVRLAIAINGNLSGAEFYNTGWVANQWNHIVASYDGATVRVYVNGTLVGSQTVTAGSINHYSTPVDIGAYETLSKSAGNVFPGAIDEVAVYPTALSSTRIAVHSDLFKTGCTDISGATSNQYSPTSADLNYKLALKVTATNADGSSSATSSQTAVVTPMPAPVNTTLPTITGASALGSALTTDNGSWNYASSYTYQWQRCDSGGANCADISGATAASHTVVFADIGSTLRSVVTAINTSASTAAASAVTGLATGSVDSYRAAVLGDGPAASWELDETSGSTAADSSGTSRTATYSGTYTHATSTAPIGSDNARSFGSTNASSTSVNGSIAATALNTTGGTFNTVELWMNWDGTTTGESVFNFASTTAAYALYINSASIGFVSGNGEMYGTSNSGLANGWHLIDAEFDNGSTNLSKLYIDGVAQTLTLAGANASPSVNASGGNVATKVGGWAADTGHTFTGQLDEVSVFKGGLSVTQVAAHWNAATAPPSNTALPSVSGDDLDGKTLTAAAGTWWPTATSFSYQWQRCDANGANCASIPGATTWSYTLKDQDVGSTIVVAVAGSNANGTGSTVASRPTVPIFPLGSPHVAPMNQAVSVASPWGYWKFNESSGTSAADASGNGHPLTVATGGWTTPSLWGKAGAASDSSSLQLRSNPSSTTAGDRAYLSSVNPSTFTDNFSVEAWVKVTPSINLQEIYGSGNPLQASPNGWGLVVTNQYGVEGQLQLYVNGNPVATGPKVPTGEWLDIGLTRSNGTWKVFLGPLLVIQHSGDSPTLSAPFEFWYGSDPVASGSGGFALLGNIASSAFYDHVLPDSTMKDHAKTLLKPKVPPSQSLGSIGNGCLSVNPASPHSPSVNTATGNFFQTATDLRAAGSGIPFAFTRTYNSANTHVGRLGQGWSDNFDWTLTKTTDTSIVVSAGCGQQLHFTHLANGTYAADGGGRVTLTTTAGGDYSLFSTGQVYYTFDATSGRLTSEKDGNGAGLLLGYASGKLTTITDAAGRVFDVDTNSNGLITKVSLRSSASSVTFAYTGSLLTKVTDLRGGDTTYVYNGAGRLATITDPTSTTVVTNTYDANTGRITDQMDGAGGHATFAWDPAAQIATVTTSDGKVWKDLYNDGVLVKWIDGTSHETFEASDPNLALTAVTSPSGDTTMMTRDANGNMLTETAPTSLGSAQKTFTYDANNNPLTVTDPKGNVTSYAYDSAGNLTSVSLNGAQLAGYTYSGAGLPLTASDGNNHTTTYAYDTDGNMTSVTDPLGHQTTYTYDATGHILTEVAPLGNITGANPADYTTSYTYDAAGDVLTETDSLGHATSYTYDSAGRALTTTDPLGHTTTNAYDGNGNPSSVTGPDPDGSGPLPAPVTSYTYDASGNQLTETDSNNHTTSYVYDASNRLISQTTADGAKTTYSYDANGNLANVTEPRGNVGGANPADYTTAYIYDAAGRRLTSTDPLGHVTTFTYDSVGNRSTVTDANNHTSSYSYDALGRMATVTAPDGGVTSYTYDGNGNMLVRTDANSHTTTYVYDGANERVQATGQDPDGTGPAPAPVKSYAYDANGNLTSTTDPNGNATLAVGDGTTTSTYDRAGSITGVTYSDATPSLTFSYDAAGNRTGMTDGVGSVSYTYDNLDRLTAVTRGSDTFDYAYDTGSNVTSRTFPGGLATSYAYDVAGRMTSAATGGNTTTYAYDAAGNLITTTLPSANGYVETRTYDKAGRLTDVKNANATSTLAEFATILDAVGNPTQIVRGGAISSTTSYGYDASDRLTSVCYQTSCPNFGDPYINWTYDKVGNRLTEAQPSGTTNYTYNAADELTQAGSRSYSYDGNGNELTDGINSHAYGLANQMISSSDGATTTSYSYDGDGNRVRASSGAASTNYLWDGNAASGLPQLALERDGSGNVLRSYAYGVRRISMAVGGSTYYYHYDDHGSVSNLSSTSGGGQWTYAYDPFGATRVATQNDPSAPTSPMQFVGEYNDPNGLYNLRARQYNPNDGRMLAVDPMAQTSGDPATSPYLYVGDRPGVLYDSSGQRNALCPDDPSMCADGVTAPPPPPPPSPAPSSPPPETQPVSSTTGGTTESYNDSTGGVTTESYNNSTGAAAASTSLYVNPFRRSRSLYASRIDMGVDYSGSGPISAIGDGVVTDYSTTGTGWQGNYLLYKLTKGSYIGRYVYVAEHIAPSVNKGDRISAGDTIARFTGGGIETGWGTSHVNVTYAFATTGYKEGQKTPAGISFAHFLHSLGVPVCWTCH